MSLTSKQRQHRIQAAAKAIQMLDGIDFYEARDTAEVALDAADESMPVVTAKTLEKERAAWRRTRSYLKTKLGEDA